MDNGWALQYSVLTCYEYTTILPISKKSVDGALTIKEALSLTDLLILNLAIFLQQFSRKFWVKG